MVLALESRRQIEFAPMVWVEGFWESFFETFAESWLACALLRKALCIKPSVFMSLGSLRQ